VEAAIAQTSTKTLKILEAPKEIREELIQQRHLEDYNAVAVVLPRHRTNQRYRALSGFEVLIGRNRVRMVHSYTFQSGWDYDLCLHAQEIPGSHVLLSQILLDEAISNYADLRRLLLC